MKERIKTYIRNSSTCKKAIKKLYDVSTQENSKKNSNVPVSSTSKKKDAAYSAIIYPQTKESLYNKRINNYLLEKQRDSDLGENKNDEQ